MDGWGDILISGLGFKGNPSSLVSLVCPRDSEAYGFGRKGHPHKDRERESFKYSLKGSRRRVVVRLISHDTFTTQSCEMKYALLPLAVPVAFDLSMPSDCTVFGFRGSDATQLFA